MFQNFKITLQNNKNLLVYYFSLTTLTLILFCPIFRFVVKNTAYFFSGIDIIKLHKVKIQQISDLGLLQFCILPLPILLKISVVMQCLALIFGNILLKFRKYVWAATSFLVGFFSVFVFTLSVNEFRKNILNSKLNLNKIFLNASLTYKLLIVLLLIFAIFSILKCGKEKLAESVFFCSTIVSTLIACSIITYIVIYGVPGIAKIGVLNFLFGTAWSPNLNKYGVFHLITSSIFSTIGATFLATPFGILCATYLSEFAPKRLLFFINPIVEILAGVPSVVYGFFGMTVIVPTIRNIFINFNLLDSMPVVGDSLLAVIVVLTIMILPTIVSTCFVTLQSTPKSLREASLNLGATKVQTVFKVTLKNAKGGIFSGVTLAVAKAIGETMAVIMVAGNVVRPPELLGPVRLLTTGIAIDMAYSSGLLRQALFGIGLLLLALIVVANISFAAISKKRLKP